ncbi:MAG TPA: tetratricopeptide repeat protein [Candidatus Acidoferrales bacterium]|jgi:tetratricopeptide (TPR) repeat protein|nr:tetratricopeptide repeat protein [Candidatus Acidoferrales bacterium]
MKLNRFVFAFALAGVSVLPAFGQNAPADPFAGPSEKLTPRADAYYNFTMGHLYELQYEQTSQPEYATKAIDAYKKAYAIDPKSPIIGERLAEMYWKAQRVRDAVNEANEILKHDPDDLATHRLLGRIYLRSLGDISGSGVQTEMVAKAITEYVQVHRLDPSDQEASLWLARLYRLHNEPDKAEQVLRKMLEDDPGNEAAAEQLTQLLLDENKADEAIKLLEDMTAQSTSATLFDLLGDAYTQNHDYAKAEVAYRKAVDLDPTELNHLRGLGQTLLSEEKYSDALTVYQKLIDLMPDDSDNYLRMAQIYRELHQLDKAEENLVKARQYNPGSLEVLFNEAMIYEAQGRYDDAIRVISDAITGVKAQSTVLPSNRRRLAVLYQELGTLYRDVQNYQAAIYTFQELGHLGDEEDRRARLLIMETYRLAKDMPKALQAGKEALAKYPDDRAIKSSLALLLGENQQTDEAAKLLESGLKGTAADRDIYLNLSQVYEQGRRYPEAEQAARKAESLASEPQDNEIAWLLLGAVYDKQKQYDKAEEEFKKALGVNPKNAQVLNYYGYMLADRGVRLDEAHDLIQRAVDQEPFNGAYLDSLGWVYFKQNKLEEAESMLRKAVEHEPRDPTIRLHLGDVLAKQGHMDLAAVEWEKSLNEWHRSLPADLESDKVAEVEKKLNQVKHRVAQKTPATDAKP